MDPLLLLEIVLQLSIYLGRCLIFAPSNLYTWYLRHYPWIQQAPPIEKHHLAQFGSFYRDKSPILYIPGINSHYSDCTHLFHYLGQQVGQSTYSLHIESMMEQSLDHMAQQIETAVKHLARIHNNHKVHIVGFSYGGLVALYTLPRIPTSIASIITIASPLRGTWAARLPSPIVPDTLRKHLHPDHSKQHLEKINTVKNKSAQIVSFYVDYDHLVFPPLSSMTLPPNTLYPNVRNIRYRGNRVHSNLIHSQTIAKHISDIVRDP